MHTSKRPTNARPLDRGATIRFPATVSAKLDEIARKRARETGNPITRSDIVREIVHRALATTTEGQTT